MEDRGLKTLTDELTTAMPKPALSAAARGSREAGMSDSHHIRDNAHHYCCMATRLHRLNYVLQMQSSMYLYLHAILAAHI